jgi:hypothetical protein
LFDFLDGKELADGIKCYIFLKGNKVIFHLPCLESWPPATFSSFCQENGRVQKLLGENVHVPFERRMVQPQYAYRSKENCSKSIFNYKLNGIRQLQRGGKIKNILQSILDWFLHI